MWRKRRKKLVGARGFEPPTPCSRSKCATRLRYAPHRPSVVRLAVHQPRGMKAATGKRAYSGSGGGLQGSRPAPSNHLRDAHHTEQTPLNLNQRAAQAHQTAACARDNGMRIRERVQTERYRGSVVLSPAVQCSRNNSPSKRVAGSTPTKGVKRTAFAARAITVQRRGEHFPWHLET